MSDTLAFALALAAGALLGAFFSGGLWWTVQKGVTSEMPALWFLCSLVLRTGMILVGFYFVAQGHWLRFAACLIGFLLARVIVVKWLTLAPVEERPQEKESRDAHES